MESRLPNRLAILKQIDGGSRFWAEGNRSMQTVAIMSGKGGVGKSFVAIGLASALQRRTGAVGILDADITGASVPHLLGVPKGPRADAEGKLLPGISPDGIKVASMSLLLPADNKAVIWRGPMISNAIGQLFNDTKWGELEYLIVDLPPGTSDAALTVLDSIKPDGVVVVSTPQDMVTNVAHKSQDMAQVIGTNVLGLVMNMAYTTCPHCNERIDLFGPLAEPKQDDLPRLATLPLVADWAAHADAGRSAQVAIDEFDALAEQVLAALGA